MSKYFNHAVFVSITITLNQRHSRFGYLVRFETGTYALVVVHLAVCGERLFFRRHGCLLGSCGTSFPTLPDLSLTLMVPLASLYTLAAEADATHDMGDAR